MVPKYFLPAVFIFASRDACTGGVRRVAERMRVENSFMDQMKGLGVTVQKGGCVALWRGGAEEYLIGVKFVVLSLYIVVLEVVI